MRRCSAAVAAGFAVAAALAAASVGVAWAAFTSTTSNPASSLAAAPDWTPPTASATVIGKTTGGAVGYIRPNANYYIYATVADNGNPPSGTATVSADVSSVTAGQTAAPLAAGSFLRFGVTYNWRSAVLSSDTPLPQVSYAYSLTSKDVLGYTGTQGGYTVVVDSTVPSATDIDLTNGGATAGRIETGDVIKYTANDVLDANSILSGWTGGATAVVVRITNNAQKDQFTVWDGSNSLQLHLGSVNTNANLVGAATTFNATMTQSGNVVTVVLGSMVSGSLNTDADAASAIWSPSSIASDRAGNSMTTTDAGESGAADPNF